MNLSDVVSRQRRERPFAVALLTERLTLSFDALDEVVWRLAARFASLDLGKGAALALSFRSQATHLIASLAAFRAAIAQTSVPGTMPALLGNGLLQRTRAAAIASDDPDVTGRFDAPLVTVDLAALLEDRSPISFEARREEPDAPALYVQGSGTTGAPRIIVHTTRGLFAMLSRELRIWPIRPGERHLAVTPYDYFTSKRRSIAFLAGGGSAVFLDNSTPLLGACDRLAVDHLSLVVPQAQRMLRLLSDAESRDPRLPNLQSLIIGASPVSELLRERMRTSLSPNTWIGYGTNEFGQATIAKPANQSMHPGCVGRPCAGVGLQVVDDDDAVLPPGRTGRVRLRAKGVFTGYLDEPEASARVLREGWYYPGDLGALTADGTLVFKGRTDDLMIFDGINVYPREIEAVLEQNPCVVEAAAFPVDSAMHNQVPVAAVEVSSPVVEAELLAFCRERLGTHAPARIHVSEKLPRNTGGKVLKRELALRMGASFRAGGDQA
ncbi:MAG: long-chain fatty acid--CoA ligase [Burkholderiaceae bacterium]|nr:long-chain fatty acid--CoA ligase [Burkholderiaceae bacterium]